MTHAFAWPRLYDALLLFLTRGRVREYREDLLDLAGIGAGHQVLDVGCGTGTQALAIAHRAGPEGFVAGIDRSSNMLALARRKARRSGLDIALERADATSLPYRGECFDIVTITTVLHAVRVGEHRRCVREAARVLKSGGRVLLVDFAGDPGQRRSWIARHGIHGRFDLHDIQGLLSREGFEEIDRGPLDWLGLHYLRGTKR